MNAKTLLFVALVAFTLYYIINWVRLARKAGVSGVPRPSAANVGIGAVANFFDALGIGSFATTTSIWKFFKLIDDRVIPGTLNVGHTLPTVTQAFIFIAIVTVDTTTLISLIAASVLGAWLGAGIVAKWDRRKVQIGMSFALIAAAALMLATQLQWIPGGGEATALTGTKLVIGLVGNFALGALMSLGIGLYGPCMIMISLLGMAPTAAFPIMMGSCAFLMPVGSVKFIREGGYDLRTALSMGLGGIPAVLVAALLVKSLPLSAVRWLVVFVVLYTAFMMLRSASRSRTAPAPEMAAAPAAD